MFKPNRVGTPYVLNDSGVGDDANWTPNAQAIAGLSQPGNVINGVPLLDMGVSILHWASATPEAIAANTRIALGLQFTVTAPLEGDTLGVELMGSLQVRAPGDVTMIPRINKLSAASGSRYAATSASTAGCYFGPSLSGIPGNTTIGVRHLAYKEQVVITGQPPRTGGGVYYHCIEVLCPTAFDLTMFVACFGVRQLNDQEDIGYRDTRR